MKSIYIALLIIITLSAAWGGEPVSIDEFKKIPYESERRKIIEQAPPEQKEELKKIDLHLALLDGWGGEAGLKAAKERQVIAARGLGNLETVFPQHLTLWEGYISDVDTANEKAGMTHERMAKEDRRLHEEEEPIRTRLPVIQSLIFHLAASPQALKLEIKAEKLRIELTRRLTSDGKTPDQPITTEERMKFDKQIQQIYDEMKTLPKLTPEQAKKELDALTDDKIRGGLWGD